MIDPCDSTPCPEECRRRAIYRAWAAETPRDPVKIRAICERAAATTETVRIDRRVGPPSAVAVDYGTLPAGFRPCCGSSVPESLSP